MDTRILNQVSAIAGTLISAVFTIVPEGVFKHGLVECFWSETTIIVTNRVLTCLAIVALSVVGCAIYRCVRCSVRVLGKSFTIKIEYKDLLKVKKGKKVINFDECFSTNVGEKPEDIKPNSVCGQYLKKNPIPDMQRLIQESGVQSSGFSQYNKKDAFTPGTIIPRGDYFLMAFAKLSEKGIGAIAYEEYLKCLDTLWEQIDLYHGMDDVYLPVLGSGITRFDRELTQQELLDIMIASYRLSPKKMKKQFTLHIVCKKCDGFSLNDIFGVS